MKKILYPLIFIVTCSLIRAQTFIRSELPTSLTTPWEIIYGPDNYLWLTEAGGKVIRVDPLTGAKQNVYTASDYFDGGNTEQLTLCFQPRIGAGTLGMALHPDFMNPSTSYIYYVYSYNSGTSSNPITKFKIERLKWEASSFSIAEHITLVSSMPTGYDHLGGRLMIIPQNEVPYLFFTVGDNGVSETNAPDCYSSQALNPNNFAQDPNYKNGKIHRFHLDGSIPSDNPIAGNSFYTRGHRNPQGLMFNPDKNIIYDIEHGDRTDDEINILEAGMNYGWKNVRGFHNDNNYPGESTYVATYTPNPTIANDGLREPILTWCSTPQPTDPAFLDWCTVAPSDGIYYGSKGIPEWTNSLLVTTLKDGVTTDQEVYQFKLNADGRTLVPSTISEPNPKRFFGADEAQNGRLRDIAISPDGKKIFLINNGATTSDKISIYKYVSQPSECKLLVYPNPAGESLNIACSESLKGVKVYNFMKEEIMNFNAAVKTIDISILPTGIYFLAMHTLEDKIVYQFFIKPN